MNMDEDCRHICNASYNMLVAWYLMANYAYYWLDQSLISDACFDEICRRLALRWRHINHRHKGLIERGLNPERVGSCFLAREDYPSIVRDATARLLRTMASMPAPDPAPLPQRRPRRELGKQGFFA